MATASEPLVVGYWTIRGLGAPCRMMAVFAGVPVRCRAHDLRPKAGGGWDLSDWHTEKAVLKKRNPLINLPYVIDGDKVITQSNAVLAYLGRKFDLFGSTADEVATCDQMLCELMDLRDNMTKYAYGRDGNQGSKEAAEALIKGQCASGSLSKIHAYLAAKAPAFSSSAPFLVGTKASAPDFHLFEMLDQFALLAKFHGIESPTDILPHFKTFHDAWLKLPQLQPYLKSKLHAMPCNQKMAKFGANPDGSRWNKAGQAYDWDVGTVEFNVAAAN